MRNPMLSLLAVGLLAFRPEFLLAQEKLPLTLQPVWESSAGNHGRSPITSFSADGKVAFFLDYKLNQLVGRDTTSWKTTGDVLPRPMGNQLHWYNVTSPDGKLGAKSSSVYENNGVERAGQITFFEFPSGKTLATVQAHTASPRLIFAPDGKTLVSGGKDGTIFWDTQTFQKKQTIKHAAGQAYGFYFTPDGKTLAINTGGGAYPDEVEIWDMVKGKHRVTLGGHGAQAWRVAYAPDGKQIASTGNDAVLRFWDANTGMSVGTVRLQYSHKMPGLAYSPDSKMLAVGDGAVIRVFNPQTLEQLFELKGHTTDVSTLAFRPDNKQLASGSRGIVWKQDEPNILPGEIILWDIPNAKDFKTMKYHANGTNVVTYSPDGKTLATGGGGSYYGKSINEVAGESKRAIAFWKTTTGEFIKTLTVDKDYQVSALAFSPDGTMLAHNGMDGSQIQVLNAQTGNELRKLQLRNTASALAFSKDGKTLAAVGFAGGYDSGKGFIQLFDPATGKQLAQKIAHTDGANAVVFDPTSEAALTAGGDGAIWKWAITPSPKK